MTTRIKESDENLTILRLDGGGIPIYEYKGKPFTGIVYDEEDNGSIAWEEEYNEGYQEGWVKYYYSNGALRQQSKKHNNEIVDGTFKKWDENGHVIESF